MRRKLRSVANEQLTPLKRIHTMHSMNANHLAVRNLPEKLAGARSKEAEAWHIAESDRDRSAAAELGR